jgi:uncharacterized protein (DUF1499 family)
MWSFSSVRKRLMYIAAGVVAILVILGVVWLFATVDDWSRDLTTNFAATSATAEKSSLYPIISAKPPTELADLVAAAAQQLPGWELAAREENGEETALRFVRTTRFMRFKDDITVHIRPHESNGDTPPYEVSAESQSRVGKGDFGQNPRNLIELMDTLRSLLR